MELDAVLLVLDGMDAAGVRHWVAGGWGVDALAGRQTRAHRDLDLAIDAEHWDRSLQVVDRLGYATETDWWPVRVEVRSLVGWVDLHPVRFDESGDGVQAGLDGVTFAYPKEHLVVGSLAGRAIPCVSAQWQVRARSGYDLRPKDVHDLAVLDGLLGT